jgi:UDP-glucuronate 4-epimerase
MKIVVTGAAGFIGQNLSLRLLKQGHKVLAIDSMNSYYATSLKLLRISELKEMEEKERFTFIPLDICEHEANVQVRQFEPDVIIHLSAQPGVRLGLAGAKQYSRDNIESFLAAIRMAIESGTKDFLYASSSSVYGASSKIPFSESEINLNPTSIYGVTKLANEFFARSINDSELRCRGLRFFSVYGPRGRPDMAYFKAIAASILGTKFVRNGSGDIARDFTYVDDVCESIIILVDELKTRSLGFKDVVNIGGGNPLTINALLQTVAQKTGKVIQVEEKNPIKEDLLLTQANYAYLEVLTGKKSFVDFRTGINKTVDWFLKYPAETISGWLD